jgi:nucleoside-diphosphate-sugar epimerase
MKKALVCGAGGFIGSHLVKRLKKDGYWVRGVDQKKPEFSETAADDFLLLDLREQENCEKAVSTLDETEFVMKYINWRLTWGGWALSILPNVRLCVTVLL